MQVNWQVRQKDSGTPESRKAREEMDMIGEPRVKFLRLWLEVNFVLYASTFSRGLSLSCRSTQHSVLHHQT